MVVFYIQKNNWFQNEDGLPDALKEEKIDMSKGRQTLNLTAVVLKFPRALLGKEPEPWLVRFF